MKVACAIAGCILVAGCGSGESPAQSNPAASAHIARSTIIDDAQMGDTPGHFSYVGRWEHVRGRHDGRMNGTSSRSWHAGDNLVLAYIGNELLVYGVTGPNGGNASVSIDGRYYGIANFYSTHLQAHRLVYSVPPLGEGIHTIGLLVSYTPNYAHRRYVNVDSVTILHAR
jgi:hypothetical protein